MSLFVSPVVRATDANNAVLSGAKWFFYATGGTTPAAIYTTSALNVAHANPVVANSAGLFAPIYLDPSIDYRATLKSSSGSVIQDIDPYDPMDLGVFGYITGDGGSVTQTTSKSNPVSLNKLCGRITTHDAALASGAMASFVFNNSHLDEGDVMVANVRLASDGVSINGVNQYRVRAGNISAGICAVVLENATGGSLSEAVVIDFVIIKGVSA